MFWKKKKNTKVGKIELGLEVKRCAECPNSQRPCLIDGQPALFHGWVDDDRAFLRINVLIPESEQRSIWREFQKTGYVPSGCSTEVQRVTVALVEYPDGSLGKVKPELVTFVDHREG